MIFTQPLFQPLREEDFNTLAMETFRFQRKNNQVYSAFTGHLGIMDSSVSHYSHIPFFPAGMFKGHRIYAADRQPEALFMSSGTTSSQRSIHEVADLSIYRSSLLGSFKHFYGPPGDYLICALIPSPEEQPHSSLAFMVNSLIRAGAHPQSGFYLYDQTGLANLLASNIEHRTSNTDNRQSKLLIIGLAYALLDFAEKYSMPLPGAVIMETGGMKGRRLEMIREELHRLLKKAFKVDKIHSEYGMAELLSQAYSHGNGRFFTPPWMRVLICELNDPLSWAKPGRTGGINIIDLANIHSCPFIATQDLGKCHEDGSFEVLGRFDYSDLRGCNLMIE